MKQKQRNTVDTSGAAPEIEGTAAKFAGDGEKIVLSIVLPFGADQAAQVAELVARGAVTVTARQLAFGDVPFAGKRKSEDSDDERNDPA